MKKISSVSFLLLTILFLVLTPFLSATELTILTEEMPPYNYSDENGDAAGFSTEIMREMMKRSGLKIAGGKIEVLPWARAYIMIQEEKNVILFSMTRTKKREKMFKWVGPIASRTIWLWKMKERKDIKATSFEEVKKYSVGAVRDFASTKYMEELGFSLDLCNREERNFKKLIAGRVDMLSALELAAAYHMNKQNKGFSNLERVVKLDDRYSYFLALNKNTSDEIVSKLQKALDDMKNDGTYEKIKHLYLSN